MDEMEVVKKVPEKPWTCHCGHVTRERYARIEHLTSHNPSPEQWATAHNQIQAMKPPSRSGGT